MPRDRSRSRERDRNGNGEGSSSRRRSRSRSPGRSERHRWRDDRDSDQRRRNNGDSSSSKRHRDRDENHKNDDEDEGERRRRQKRREKERKSRDRDSSEERDRKAKKRARRARDDEAAIAAAEEQRRAAAELSVYSTVDNPFNDANLTDAFVWGKKRDKEKKAGITAEEAKRKDAERRIEAKEELERLNRRRADREKEMEEREEEANRQARLAESAQMEAWHAKEDDFHLEQAMRRAQIRTREGRAKPIDLLALNLKWSKPHVPGENGADGEDEEEDEGVGMDVDLEEPYLIFDNLTLEETEELYEDITMYISLEKSEANLEFWRAMMVVCSSALEILRSERTMGRAAFLEQNRASEAVKSDITELLKGKSLAELRQLQESVRAKLASGDPIDVEYWEGLLRELAVWMAKAKLRTMHEVVLRNRLEHLRRKQRDEAVRVQSVLAQQVQEDDEEAARLLLAQAGEEEKASQEIVQEKWEEGMEPKLVTRIPMEDQHLQLVEPEEELKRLVSSCFRFYT